MLLSCHLPSRSGHPAGARPPLRAKMINIKPPIDARKRTPDRTLMLIISGQRAARAPPADRNAAQRSRSAAVVLALDLARSIQFMPAVDGEPDVRSCALRLARRVMECPVCVS